MPTKTANEKLLDLLLRHEVDLRRFTSGEVKKMLKLLSSLDSEIETKLRRGLSELVTGSPLPFTPEQQKRLESLFADVTTVRAAALKQTLESLTNTNIELAGLEAALGVQVLADAIPFVIKISGVDVNTLKAAATSRPFQGKLLSEWFSSLEQVDQDRIKTSIKKGLSLGEDLNTIVKRVMGTSSKAFGDGTLAETRRNAEAITRTAINHTANSAREEIWKANSDILLGLMWNSTLDGRTSAVCRARDGQVAFYSEKHGNYPALNPQGARPPAHINCRSGMVPIISPEEVVGQRAFVTDTRTTKEREVDFRQTAKADAGPKWAKLSPQEKQDAIRRARENWSRANIGQVPSNFTYQDWLKKQPAAFQDEVLGVTKGKLFRDGGLKLENYVDRAGNELNLDELRERYPGAFDKAGIE